MDRSLFSASDAGRVVRTRTGYDAFVPADLPPALVWDTRVAKAIESAAMAVGKANTLIAGGASSKFSGLLLAKEAASVAAVEGQPTTVEEVLTASATGVTASRGAQLALNYITAFNHVAARLDEMPISLRLMREAHYVLSQGLEHSGSYPGEFRRSQNWLGPEGCGLSGATLVPPPVEEMKTALGNWERYLHISGPLPSSIKTALLHYQFVVVRPFLEYNDAIMLAVMPFVLRELGLASWPIPFAAGFVRRRLQEYQQRILDVCQRGAWNEWLTFYLFGMSGAFHEAFSAVQRLIELRARHADLLRGGSELAIQCLDAAWHQPVLTAASAPGLTIDSRTKTAPVLEELVDLGIVELHERPAGSVYVATDIVAALEQPSTLSPGYPPLF